MSKYFVIARDPWDYDRIIKKFDLPTHITFMASSLCNAVDGVVMNRKNAGIRAEVWTVNGRLDLSWLDELLDGLESGAINPADEIAKYNALAKAA